LGYSLFDHAQQLLTCPSASSDPLIQYYCQARAALGPAASPTSYTAWVIYPAIHGLQEPFYEATAGYARLSFRLIAAQPLRYGTNVAHSFLAFWKDDIPMVDAFLGERGAKLVIPLDKCLRWGTGICFFLSLAVLSLRPVWRDRDRFVFCVVLISLVLGSATVQALAESGWEQARFAVPTMPLLIVVSVYLIGMLPERVPSA
jgi:hypothetical protein